MYQTAGTQINLDYSDEKNFTDMFKLITYLTPISVALFANSSIKENKFNKYLSYRSIVWQNTARGGLPEIFLENMTFEKYADFCLNMPLLFLIKNGQYLDPDDFTFKDFLENKITKINKEGPSKKDLEWGKIFLDICKTGLSLRNKINKKGNNEIVYLKNIENIISEEKTKAEKSIKIA